MSLGTYAYNDDFGPKTYTYLPNYMNYITIGMSIMLTAVTWIGYIITSLSIEYVVFMVMFIFFNIVIWIAIRAAWFARDTDWVKSILFIDRNKDWKKCRKQKKMINRELLFKQISMRTRLRNYFNGHNVLRKRNVKQLPSPNDVSFDGVNANIEMNDGYLSSIWKIRGSDQRSWISNNLNMDVDLLGLMEEEFQRYKHILTMDTTMYISQSYDKKLEFGGNMNVWLDNNFIQLITMYPEMNTDIHRLYFKGTKSEQEKFLQEIRTARNKIKDMYNIKEMVDMVMIYQRLCMVELIYRKTMSLIASGSEFMCVRQNNSLEKVNIVVSHNKNNGRSEDLLINGNNKHSDHYSRYRIIKCHVLRKRGNVNDYKNKDDYIKATYIIGINRNTRREENNLIQTDSYGDPIVVEEFGDNINICKHIEGKVLKKEIKGSNVRRYRRANVGIKSYVDRNELLTSNEMSTFYDVVANIGLGVYNNNNNVIGSVSNLDMRLIIYGYVMYNTMVSDRMDVFGKYKYFSDDIGYRCLELYDNRNLLMMYVGTGHFSEGVRRIKKLHLCGDRNIQQEIDKRTPSGVEIEWDNKEERNDHTMAHNISEVKRTEVINSLAGTSVLLEVASNLSSQIYTSGLIINLPMIDQMDIERRHNLDKKIKNLLKFEHNSYVCLNFQELAEINVQGWGVEAVMMHNVVHNIPFIDTLQFFINNPINIIETTTYLPIEILHRKNFYDTVAGMEWQLRENKDATGLFNDYKYDVCAHMPAGDPLYVHSLSNLYDYFTTSCIKLNNLNGERDVRNDRVLGFIIKDTLDSYIRMRIVKTNVVKEYSESRLNARSRMSNQILHLKGNSWGVEVMEYNVDLSDAYRTHALSDGSGNHSHRQYLMKSVRMEKTSGDPGVIRMLDAVNKGCNIYFIDDMADPIDLYKELKNKEGCLFVLSHAAYFTRYNYEMDAEFDTWEEFGSMNDRGKLILGEFEKFSDVLQEYKYGDDVEGYIKYVKYITSRYNLQIINGKNFYVDAGREETLVVDKSSNGYVIRMIKTSEVYEEDCIQISDVKDIVNVLMYRLESISDEDCCYTLLRRFELEMTENEKGEWNLHKLRDTIKGRINYGDKPDKYYEKEIVTQFEKVTFDRPIINYEEHPDHNARRIINNNQQLPPLQQGSTEEVNVTRRRSGIVPSKYYKQNKANVNSKYTLIYKDRIETNMVINNQGVRQLEMGDAQLMSDCPIMVLVVKNHVYQISGGYQYFTDVSYNNGITAEQFSVRVGKINKQPERLAIRSITFKSEVIVDPSYMNNGHKTYVVMGCEVNEDQCCDEKELVINGVEVIMNKVITDTNCGNVGKNDRIKTINGRKKGRRHHNKRRRRNNK